MKIISFLLKQKLILSIAGFIFLANTTFSQPPDRYSYQAVLRDASGNVRANSNVSIGISILQGSASGNSVFNETHTVNTNSMGLITLEIGSVNTSDLKNIDWSDGPYFIKIEVDGTEMGTSQLLSVPYALYAKTVETDMVDDADADPSNEIQTLTLAGSNLSLSNGGGTVTLPSSGTADNWGTQTVESDASLSGNGTSVSPLKIAQRSASTGQVLKWNGSYWAPSADETGNGESSPTGPAGGDLAGTYPNPTIGNGKVTSQKILDGTITSDDISSDAVNSTKVQDGSIVTEDLADNTVSTDKLGDLAVSVFKIQDNAVMTNKISDGAVTGTKISNNAVSSSKIQDGSIATADLADNVVSTDKLGNTTVSTAKIQNNAVTTNKIADGAVTGTKIGQEGASNGQVLKWNGTKWMPADDNNDLDLPYTQSTSSSGSAFTIENSSGNGIYGRSTPDAPTGAAGVIAVSDATEGIGIYTIGSVGVEAIGGPFGVHAKALAEDSYGIYGEALGSNGVGVQGKGNLYGIMGTGTITNSIGVYGLANIGYSTGVYGFGSRFGVRGSGSIGVQGYTNDDEGIGIKGWAASATSVNYGVYGITYSAEGYGVYGTASVYGVYGYSMDNKGRAVMGEAEDESSIGVYGKALAANSTGVWGEGANYDFYANGPGTNYGASSSIRWKKNLTPINNPLEKVKAIRGVYFDWDNEHGGQHDVGMIAEEVGKVLPEIVVYEENGVDASGMDYSKTTPLLLEAIKAQQAEIEQLMEEINKLKEKIKNMEDL